MYRVLNVITYFGCAYPVNTIILSKSVNISFMRPCCYICHYSDKCAYIMSFAVQVKDVMKDVMADLQQTNSEKILLSWVRQSTKNYKDTNVVNFSSSWADGFAFNALIHSHRCVELLFLGGFFFYHRNRWFHD